MKKKVLFAAMALVALASCSDETFVGDVTTSPQDNSPSESNAIVFASASKGITRADIYGSAAAELLGKNFYVAGTKGTEDTGNPSPDVVFNNYLVTYSANTAGKTESNTANWEYVNVTPDGNHVKLTPVSTQTIKYWDYSQPQYDFLAFSTGTFKAVSKTNLSGEGDNPIASNEIGVTAMKYGAELANKATAYTFYLPSISALENTFITDITEVEKTNYGKEVQLKFKNLGSKVRVALYETVPGYSVQAASVTFYTVDGSTNFNDAKGTPAALISQDASSFATKGVVKVSFPNVGTDNDQNDNYNKASATVESPAGGDTKKTFGNLAAGKYAAAEGSETPGSSYLGRTLPNATFAGDANASYYTTVFPVSTSYPLTLRIDYTLISTDGQGETINVKGAKAVVPSTYTKWQPNYAYTYIFKISDNTNGWTGTASENAGLYPITFDAVVAEATDPSGEQTTVTTVATPSITTYQQGHTYATNEYDNGGEKLYVQVMDNNFTPAKLVGTSPSKLPLLNAAKDGETPKYHASLLYKLDDENATEAKVMDALENRNAPIGDYNSDVEGRNGLSLTYNSNIDNTVTKIQNGVDDNEISVAAGEAAEIDISTLTATGAYAYVYDYSWSSTSEAWSTGTGYTAKNEVVIYEPVTPASSEAIGSKAKYYKITTSALDGVTPSDAVVTVDDAHLYFSKTKNGTSTTTYSYISVVNKIGATLPKGVVVVAKSDTSIITEVDGSSAPSSNTFYFDKYYSNDGKYAVKVIKVI